MQRLISVRSSALMRRTHLLALAVAAAPMAINSIATATPTYDYWKNADLAGSWTTSNDWSASSATGSDNGGVPGSITNVNIANTTATSFTITLNESDTISALQIGDTGSGTDTLSLSGAFDLAVSNMITLNTGGILSQSVGSFTAAGVNQSGGSAALEGLIVAGGPSVSISAAGEDVVGSYSMSGGTLAVTYGETLGLLGTGTFNQSGGVASNGGLSLGGLVAGSTGAYTLSNTGSLTVNGSVSVGDTNGATGTLAINGGSLSISNAIYIYAGGTVNQTAGTFSAAAITQSGGVVSVPGLDVASSFAAEGNSANAGSYTLSGTGSLTVNGTENVGNAVGAFPGTVYGSGTFNQSGGSQHITGFLTVGADFGSISGTYLLSAGTLSVDGDVYVGSNFGSGTFNQSGGFETVGSVASPSALFLTFTIGSVGNYFLSAGTLTVNGNEYIGGSGVGTFAQSGGVNIVGSAS
jgi:hypothetical protein